MSDLDSFDGLNYNLHSKDARVLCQEWGDKDMDDWGNVHPDIWDLVACPYFHFWGRMNDF